MFHLSEEYITGSFRKIGERFDALEQRLPHQTRELENHTDAKIKNSSRSASARSWTLYSNCSTHDRK